MKKKLFLAIIAVTLQVAFVFAQMTVTVTPTKNTPCDTCVKLTSNVTGGTAPYTYQWYLHTNSQPFTTGQIINYCNKYPSTFSSDSIILVVTDANSLQASYFNWMTNLLSSTIPIAYKLCIVTVDSATGKNLLVWSQTNNPSVVSYNIYKMNTSSVMEVIANVPRNSFSTFIDTSSKPAQVSADYSISVLDSCGFESSLLWSDVTTIHLVISAGIPPAWNLAWNSTQGYSIVKYRIWRAITPNNPVLIDSVANSIFAYTDLTPPIGVLYYTIEAVSTAACNPSLKTENINSIYSSSFSNVANNGYDGVNEYNLNNKISIYPNPTSGVFNLQTSKLENPIIEISNVFGEKIYSKKIQNENSRIDLSKQPNGIYFLKLQTSAGEGIKKIIIQK